MQKKKGSPFHRIDTDMNISSNILNNINLLVILFNMDGNIIKFNKFAEKLTGYKEDEMIGKKWNDILISRKIHQNFSNIISMVKKSNNTQNFVYYILRKDRSQADVLCNINTMYDSKNEPIAILAIGMDISEHKSTYNRVYDLSFQDMFTGLPNRAILKDKLHSVLKNVSHKNQKAALLYLDLDNFKTVNDTIGHIEENILLNEIEQILKNCIRSVDIITRIRWYEFSIILTNICCVEDAAIIAERIIKAFQKNWLLEGTEFYITVSIGIALFPNDGCIIQDLLKNAFTAMYYAKQHGKSIYKFYHPDFMNSLLKRLNLQANLKKAVDQNELVVYYQPQVNLNTGKIVGVEALVRWMHPIKGLILPDKFIQFAEESGLITSIDEYVLRTACMQNKNWQDKGYPPIYMSVNFSALQFRQPNIVDIVTCILRNTGMDGKWLNLEITESVAMNDINRAIDLINKFNKMGIMVSLDDFGTGYSSLNYLKRLPIDRIKLDQTFIRNIVNSSDEEEIAKAIITLAHKLGLIVTAEGVETIEQLNFLKSQNCDNAQGYFFSKPVPSRCVEALLKWYS